MEIVKDTPVRKSRRIDDSDDDDSEAEDSGPSRRAVSHTRRQPQASRVIAISDDDDDDDDVEIPAQRRVKPAAVRRRKPASRKASVSSADVGTYQPTSLDVKNRGYNGVWNPDPCDAADDEHYMKLKASVLYGVDKVCTEVANDLNRASDKPSRKITMTGDVVKAIAAVAVVYSKKMAMDLEAFSKHAGRQHINADDCKLLARNLPGLLSVLSAREGAGASR